MMPNMQSTLNGFEETLQFQLVKKTVVDHDLDQTSKVVPVLWFEGNLQPVPPQKLMIKTEGERKWKWWTLYTDLELTLDTVIKDQNAVEYRVISLTDWSQSGVYQYELVEGLGV